MVLSPISSSWLFDSCRSSLVISLHLTKDGSSVICHGDFLWGGKGDRCISVIICQTINTSGNIWTDLGQQLLSGHICFVQVCWCSTIQYHNTPRPPWVSDAATTPHGTPNSLSDPLEMSPRQFMMDLPLNSRIVGLLCSGVGWGLGGQDSGVWVKDQLTGGLDHWDEDLAVPVQTGKGRSGSFGTSWGRGEEGDWKRV